MPDTVINSKIYKKTGANTYVLYHPETGAEQVIYTKTWDSKNYGTVSAILDDITLKLDGVGGVLEFCGDATSLADASSKAGTNAKGEVYVITSSFTWKSQTYPANTLIVFTVDEPSATPSDTQFVPLGGSNSAYATKNEAVTTASLSGSTLTFQYANATTHTFAVTFPSIGTTAVSTTSITTTISNSSSNAIPTEGAVFNFASSAGKVIVAPASTDQSYYVTFVTTTNSSSGQPVYVDTGISYNPSTNILSVTATSASYATTAGSANTANTAGSVSKALSIFGESYNGATAKTVTAGQGLTVSNPTGSNTASVYVGFGNGITGNADSIAVAAKTGGAISVTEQGVDIAEMSTITADQVYSAVQVDKYGRTKAGAQSIIFAAGPNDPDLADLVVGGLAFIGTSTAATSSYSGTAKSSGNIGTMDDAE